APLPLFIFIPRLLRLEVIRQSMRSCWPLKLNSIRSNRLNPYSVKPNWLAIRVVEFYLLFPRRCDFYSGYGTIGKFFRIIIFIGLCHDQTIWSQHGGIRLLTDMHRYFNLLLSRIMCREVQIIFSSMRKIDFPNNFSRSYFQKFWVFPIVFMECRFYGVKHISAV